MTMTVLRVLKTTAIAVAALVALGAMSGAVFEQVSRERAMRKYPPAGQLVEVAGHRIQIDCRGSGSPTVVLESGLDINGSLAWMSVHDSLATKSRTCAWSRPGIMWSQPTGRSFDADSNAATLHAALEAVGARPPWVLVGHSIGGGYAVTFAARYATEMQGLVMVDPSHPDQFARYERVMGKSIAPSPTMPRIGALLAWTGIVRVLPNPANPPSWPSVIGEVGPAFLPLSIRGLVGEVEAVPATLLRAGRARSLGAMPLIVLAAGNQPPPEELAALQLSPEQGRRVHQAHLELMADMATWSTRGRLRVVENAWHYIQFDRPDAVIAAVNEVRGYVIAHDSSPRRR
jgi:pimeloyl-ACP methyl ester carboxylesterase